MEVQFTQASSLDKVVFLDAHLSMWILPLPTLVNSTSRYLQFGPFAHNQGILKRIVV